MGSMRENELPGIPNGNSATPAHPQAWETHPDPATSLWIFHGCSFPAAPPGVSRQIQNFLSQIPDPGGTRPRPGTSHSVSRSSRASSFSLSELPEGDSGSSGSRKTGIIGNAAHPVDLQPCSAHPFGAVDLRDRWSSSTFPKPGSGGVRGSGGSQQHSRVSLFSRRELRWESEAGEWQGN